MHGIEMKFRVFKKLIIAILKTFGRGMMIAGLIIFPVATRTASLYYLWKWYLLPLHMPYLKLGHAVGLTCILTIISAGNTDVYTSEKSKMVHAEFNEVLFYGGAQIVRQSLIALLIGAILQIFLSL